MHEITGLFDRPIAVDKILDEIPIWIVILDRERRIRRRSLGWKICLYARSGSKPSYPGFGNWHIAVPNNLSADMDIYRFYASRLGF